MRFFCVGKSGRALLLSAAVIAAVGTACVLTMPELSAGAGALTDIRDGKKYKTVKIGGKTWMAENLNYKTPSGSWCYADNPDSCEKYGMLYDWETAKTVCPDGWSLPDTADWHRLLEAVGGQSTAGEKLKSTSDWKRGGNGVDSYGFSALPGGHRNSNGRFGGVGDFGYWWTATYWPDPGNYGKDGSYSQLMSYMQAHVEEGANDKGGGKSVRCVMD